MDRVDSLPAKRRSPGRPISYREEAQEMRTEPGQWFKFRAYKSPQVARSVAGKLGQGRYRAFPATEFEWSARDNVVYGRARTAAADPAPEFPAVALAPLDEPESDLSDDDLAFLL